MKKNFVSFVLKELTKFMTYDAYFLILFCRCHEYIDYEQKVFIDDFVKR